MSDTRQNGTRHLICVAMAVLLTAATARSAAAAPVTIDGFNETDLCVAFDCDVATELNEAYTLPPPPDPDGLLRSLVLPGLDPSVAGLFLYLYQITQDAGSTANVSTLAINFPGFVTAVICQDCGGDLGPDSADLVGDSLTFALAGLLPGQTSALFGAISSLAPATGSVGVETASTPALVPQAQAVPEPASLMLFGIGIAALTAARRRMP